MALTIGSSDPAILAHKKRRRRRRQDKPSLAARLVLDDHVKSDVGMLSEDLFADLFPHLRTRTFESLPLPIAQLLSPPLRP